MNTDPIPEPAKPNDGRVVSYNDVRAVVFDVLRTFSVNGRPISIQGSEIINPTPTTSATLGSVQIGPATPTPAVGVTPGRNILPVSAFIGPPSPFEGERELSQAPMARDKMARTEDQGPRSLKHFNETLQGANMSQAYDSTSKTPRPQQSHERPGSFQHVPHEKVQPLQPPHRPFPAHKHSHHKPKDHKNGGDVQNVADSGPITVLGLVNGQPTYFDIIAQIIGTP